MIDLSEPIADSNEAQGSVKPYSWYVVSVLMLVYVLSFIDRKLPFILVESIKRDLELSDTQVGLLTGLVFSLIYAVASLPLARIADRGSRPRLIAIVVAVWSLMTAMGGFATSFAQLAVARAGVAIGEAGCTPASHSLLADYFPESRRGLAISIYMMGAPVGILAGLSLGGLINDLADWRVAMWAVGAPGLLIAALVVFTVREPNRNRTALLPTTSSIKTTIALMWRDPVLRLIAFGCLFFTCTSGAFNAFGAAYIIRRFGLSTTEVGLTYGLVAGIGGAIGALLGGWASDWLRRGDPRHALWLVALALLIGAPFRVLALEMSNYSALLACLLVPMTLGMVYAGPTFTTLQNRVPAANRAMATAVLIFVLNGIGLSIGPLLAGALSDAFSVPLGKDALRIALMVLVIGDFIGTWFFFLAGRALGENGGIKVNVA